MPTVAIDKSYNGPPNSGNGGYSCGLFAQLLLSQNHGQPVPQAIEVTLRNPIPLAVPLNSLPTPKGLSIQQGEQLIAEVKETSLAIDILPAPGVEAAKLAETRYAGFVEHAFPGCFVCGPQRTNGDGLRLFPGLLDDAGKKPRVADIWQPYPALADAEGYIRQEFIWAALDCPSYFGAFTGQDHPAAVLARQTVSLLQPELTVDAEYLVQAWPLSTAGRKHDAACALYTLQGDCVAVSKALWITLEA